MTNLLTESTPNIIHELLDDIKENVIQINEKCTCARPYGRSSSSSLVFLADDIRLNVIKPTNITNLLERKNASQDGSTLGSTSSDANDSPSPLILMNKQIELIHPLEHQWSFWYLKNQQGKDWQENLMKLATFGYVEEFWA